MRCSDVIDVIAITRRHVGGILSVNKRELKCKNLDFLDRVFRLAYNTIHNS